MNQAKWVVWAVVAAVSVIAIMIVKGLFTKAPVRSGEGSLLPHVPKFIEERMRAAEDNHLTTKATTKAKSEAQQQELAQITTISDGAERRRRLAAFLKTV